MRVSIAHELAPGARWYLGHTRPNSERKAELNLQAQGFATFLPQIEKTIRHGRRLKTVRRPLFLAFLRQQRKLSICYFYIITTGSVAGPQISPQRRCG
jgi:hypothetical protein